MPIIRPHHANDPWRPLKPWPDDCVVQWGGSGLVLGEEASYSTAFFEAFPGDGTAGFIRGEGKTVGEAEAAAFASFERQSGCFRAGGHQWTRSLRKAAFEDRLRNGRRIPKVATYTNGGAFCLRCSAFETALQSIPQLGDWRKPLTHSELQSLMNGYARPNPDIDAGRSEAETRRTAAWRRRMELRARLFGIDLPDHRLPQYQRAADYSPFREDAYVKACRDAVVRFYLEAKEARSLKGGVLEDFFDDMARRSIEAAVEEFRHREEEAV